MSLVRYCPPFKRVSYKQAEIIQQLYARQLLDAKASKAQGPAGALLAFEMNPVYTSGRRQVGQISQEEISHFRKNGEAEFVETLRGGHVTFHGPGQLVMYPVVDLKSLGLTVRDYVCNLEGGLIDLLKNYGIPGKRTADTGVWVSDTEKIASLGIHVRRAITSHGIGLNVSMDPIWFHRIVACNLPFAKFVNMSDYAQVDLHKVSDELAQIYAGRFGLELKRPQDIDDIPNVFEGIAAGEELYKLYKQS